MPPTEIDHQELVRDGDEYGVGVDEGLLVDAADALQVADIERILSAAIARVCSARSAPISMPTSIVVVLDSIAAARTALSDAVVPGAPCPRPWRAGDCR